MCTRIGIHRVIKAAYGVDCVDFSVVRRRSVRARNEGSSCSTLILCEREWTEKSRATADETHRSRNGDLYRFNGRITQEQLPVKRGISRERAQAVIAELELGKGCAQRAEGTLGYTCLLLFVAGSGGASTAHAQKYRRSSKQ